MFEPFSHFFNHFGVYFEAHNLTYFDKILCLTFERRFEGKCTKSMDQPGNLNVLHSGFIFDLYVFLTIFF